MTAELLRLKARDGGEEETRDADDEDADGDDGGNARRLARVETETHVARIRAARTRRANDGVEALRREQLAYNFRGDAALLRDVFVRGGGATADGASRSARARRRRRRRQQQQRRAPARDVARDDGGRDDGASASSSPMMLPGGTGDCCAPKLLADAAARGLRPVGIAEFFLGAR